jgi:hypothetical protein
MQLFIMVAPRMVPIQTCNRTLKGAGENQSFIGHGHSKSNFRQRCDMVAGRNPNVLPCTMLSVLVDALLLRARSIDLS